MRNGDKLISINEMENIKNIMNMPLFVDNEYIEVMVYLNHILYTNEYNNFTLDWVNKNFKHGR